MDSIFRSQATSGLPEYQAINTVLFIILMVIATAALANIIRFSKPRPGKRTDPFKIKFIELEKDFRWRRMKVVYIVASVVIISIVIGASYGTDTQAQLQTIYDFEVERANDRAEAAFMGILTTLFLWGGYFVFMPTTYKLLMKAKQYLGK